MNRIPAHRFWRPRAGLARLLLVAASIASAGPALAAAAEPAVTLSVAKIVVPQPGAAERRVDAAQAQPGDLLEYRAVYRNDTARTLNRAQLTLPVPLAGHAVEYVQGSAQPEAFGASRDGLRYAAAPLHVERIGADGRVQRVPAPAADYRFLRWDLGDLPPSAVRTVHARVRVLAGDAVAAAAATR